VTAAARTGRGLSEGTLFRLSQLEGRDRPLEPYERGELRAMLLSLSTADEQARVESLMRTPVDQAPAASASPPASGPSSPEGEAAGRFAAGLERASNYRPSLGGG